MSAPTAPAIHHPLPGPKARAIIDRDRARVSPSCTRDYPFAMARGDSERAKALHARSLDMKRRLGDERDLAATLANLSEVLRVLGGRSVHPINVRVGGFYRAPTRRELRTLVEADVKASLAVASSDAHYPGQLAWLPYGCDRAAACGVQIGSVVNAMGADELLAWARSHEE